MASHFYCGDEAVSAEGQPLPGAAAPSPPNAARWWTTLLVVACGASVWLATPYASAQGRKPASTLGVSSQLWLSPGSENELEVQVVPSEAVPPQSVIVIRGVPPGMHFSQGRPFGPGVWVVPAGRLTGLKLHMPADTDGDATLSVALTTLEGVSVAEAQIAIITRRPAKPNAENTAAASPGRGDAAGAFTGTTQQSSPPSASLPTAKSRAQLVMLLEKGKENLRTGNILIARHFYQRAADKGLAEAALALATTYDPHELSRMKGISGVIPDPELARKWYEKARELGSPEASARLSQLGRP
jgi:Sel1 repeat